MGTLGAFWLGRIGYADGMALMHGVARMRAEDEIDDTLLLLEHDHVYTLGRRATAADILLDESALAARGIAVAETDRGGLVTYHGPGQLVGYPVLDLGPLAGPAAYVATLERAIVDTLAGFGIRAGTIDGSRGAWVGDAKIAAIGVHVSKGITTHGFALNVDPDLSMFQGIVPCGITDKRVTSLAEATGSRVPVTLVAKRAARALAAQLDRALNWPGASALDRARPAADEVRHG